jgi:hypothetical protein
MTLRREKFREFYTNIPFYIYALALILAATFFLLFLDRFKTYNTEISVIFIPQNEKIAQHADQIAENLTIIPTKLSFYEKLLRDNKDIEDQFIGFDKDKRKELWARTIQIKREKESTIINIEANNHFESQKLAKQTAFTLFSVMSQYYNIRTDIDFRIIDGPITRSYIKNWPILAIVSLVTGMILALLINIVSLNLAGLFGKREEKKISEEKIFQSFPKIDFTEKEYPRKAEIKIPEINPVAAKKAQAPINLPIAKVESEKPDTEPDAAISKIYPLENVEIAKLEEIYEKKEEPTIKSEPTEEELKERLNQLLRGDL